MFPLKRYRCVGDIKEKVAIHNKEIVRQNETKGTEIKECSYRQGKTLKSLQEPAFVNKGMELS